MAAQIAAEKTEAHAVPTEFYLIIFLLVAMLVFTYFYSERAQTRRSASRQIRDETAQTDTLEG
jgi:hypothetical protein